MKKLRSIFITVLLLFTFSISLLDTNKLYSQESTSEDTQLQQTEEKQKDSSDQSEETPQDTDAYIIYFREECDACTKLKEDLKELNLDVVIVYKDLADPQNKDEYVETLKQCSEEDFSIPAMYYDNKCYVGRSKILTYFKNLIQQSDEYNQQPLANILGEVQTSPSNAPKISGWMIVAILVGPALLILFIYLVITKVKL